MKKCLCKKAKYGLCYDCGGTKRRLPTRTMKQQEMDNFKDEVTSGANTYDSSAGQVAEDKVRMDKYESNLKKESMVNVLREINKNLILITEILGKVANPMMTVQVPDDWDNGYTSSMARGSVSRNPLEDKGS